MSVNAFLFLVAVTILLEKAAYWHFFFNVYVKVIALISAGASILDPVDAD